MPQRKTSAILHDLIIEKYNNSYVAERNKVSRPYISTIVKRLSLMKYLPLIKDKKILCLECEGYDKDLVIHHDYKSGQPIAIVCQLCNRRIGNKVDFPKRQRSFYLYDENITGPKRDFNIKIAESTAQSIIKLKTTDYETYDEILCRLIRFYKNENRIVDF